MDDLLRKRLSEEELEAYDRFDQRASIAGHFLVWPAIFGLISYAGSKYASAMVCLALVVVSFPVIVIMGRRASRLRELAQSRYEGSAGDEPNTAPANSKGNNNSKDGQSAA